MIESSYGSCIIRRCNNNDNKNYGLLCEDIVVEILCRLPAKSLVRFKCVSKGWYYLISNVVIPRIWPLPLSGVYLFSKNQIRSRRGDYLIQYLPMPNSPQTDDDDHIGMDYWPNSWSPSPRDDGGPVKEPPPGYLPFSAYSEDLLDCCNGLFLFINRSLNQYYLWGRRTQKFVMIPTFRPRDKRVVFAALAFNPRESVHYKVVHFGRSTLVNPRESPPSLIPLDIFYSETGKWVEYSVQYRPPVDTATLVNQCIYLDGALYRLSMSRHLLRYDVKEVNVTAIKLPGIGSSSTDDKMGCIGLSMGHLHHASHDGSTLLIWMLCDGLEWVLTHSICFQELAKHPLINDFLLKFPATSGFQPLTFHPNSDAVFLWTPDIILCYHHNNNKLEVVYSKPSYRPSLERAPTRVFPYSQCLFPLKNIGQNYCRRNNLCSIQDEERIRR